MAVTLSLFAGAGAQFFDNNGVILSGGKVYTYAAGTTTPRATYTTNSDAVFHTNPIVLDSAGRVPNGGEIWLQLGVGYKFVVKTSAEVLIATYDNIPSSAQPPAANDADSIMYEQGYTVTAGSFVTGKIYRIVTVGTTDFTLIGATSNTIGLHFIATGVGTGTGTAELSQTVEAKLQQTVSVKDFGAVGDGIANDTTAIQAAYAAASTINALLKIPAGVYKVTSPLVFDNKSVSVCGDGINSSIINYTGSGVAISVGDSSGPYYSKLSEFKLVGTASADCGIKVIGVSYGVLDEVWVTGFTKSAAQGVWLYTANLTGNFVLSYIIQNCIIEANYRNLDLNGAVNGGTNAITVRGSKIRNATGDYNIYGASASFNWIIDGNVLEANGPGYPALFINGAQGVSISRNYFENTSAAPAVQLFTGSSQAVEISNNFMGTQVSHTYAINAAGSNNRGWRIVGNMIGGWTYAIALGGTYYDLDISGNFFNGVLVSDYGGTYYGVKIVDTNGNFRVYTPNYVVTGNASVSADFAVGANSTTNGFTSAAGGFGTSLVSVASATYSVPSTATRIVNYYSGTSTFTLGPAQAGREITITNIVSQAVVSASANVAAITNGVLGTAILPATAGKWATLVGDGTNWNIIATNV